MRKSEKNSYVICVCGSRIRLKSQILIIRVKFSSECGYIEKDFFRKIFAYQDFIKIFHNGVESKEK